MSHSNSPNAPNEIHGILLVDKPKGKTAFTLVASLRRLLKIKTIGHAGTLDPFATGVMVMLIGRSATRLSNQFLCQDKEYVGRVLLGITTDTFDCDGKILCQSDKIPSREEVEHALLSFQGEIEQIPPMFSAKKQSGKKLYELARKGITVERQPVKIRLVTQLLNYSYPYLDIAVSCSKGTYIRSIADDLGNLLGCGAHLAALNRTRSGQFHLADCIDGALLDSPSVDIAFVRDKIKAPLL